MVTIAVVLLVAALFGTFLFRKVENQEAARQFMDSYEFDSDTIRRIAILKGVSTQVMRVRLRALFTLMKSDRSPAVTLKTFPWAEGYLRSFSYSDEYSALSQKLFGYDVVARYVRATPFVGVN